MKSILLNFDGLAFCTCSMPATEVPTKKLTQRKAVLRCCCLVFCLLMSISLLASLTKTVHSPEFAASPLLYSSYTARGVLLHSSVTRIARIGIISPLLLWRCLRKYVLQGLLELWCIPARYLFL